MKDIKRFLHKKLGRKRYLRLISRIYYWMYRTGLLKKEPAYKLHYFVRKLIKRGDVVVDIGANLGYYSMLFSRWVGDKGRVYSVEPVRMYREVLAENLKKRVNVEIIPYALGEKEMEVEMGIPGPSEYRHGLTRIMDKPGEKYHKVEEKVQVRDAMEFFEQLPPVDYIKCDVEGYEGVVIPRLRGQIERVRPIMQVEANPANRSLLYKMMKELDYSVYFCEEGFLKAYEVSMHERSLGDLIFLPSEQIHKYESLIR